MDICTLSPYPNPNPAIPPPPPVYAKDGVDLYHGDCANILARGDIRADLIVTSPPYDDMREYGGEGYDFERCASPIAASLVEGGIMAWHTNDMIVDGGYSGNSLRARSTLWTPAACGCTTKSRSAK